MIFAAKPPRRNVVGGLFRSHVLKQVKNAEPHRRLSLVVTLDYNIVILPTCGPGFGVALKGIPFG